MNKPLPVMPLAEGQGPRCVGGPPYRMLDAWRGVAALWVVLLHVRLETTPAPLYLFSAGGHLGVPMFFVISGYCIASAATRSLNSPRPVRHFLTARVRRIYPPYFLASLVAIALSLLLTVMIQHHVVRSSQIVDLDLFHQGWRFYLGALTLTQLPLHTPYVIRVFWSLCYFRWDGRLAGLWPVRLFSWLGMFSYSLYLIHLLALGIVTQGLNRFHVIEAHPLLLYAVKVAVCIAGGRLFFQFCECPFLDTRQRQVLSYTEKGENHG